MPNPVDSALLKSAGEDPASFGAIGRAASRDGGTEPDFVAIAQSPEFLKLRGKLRHFVFPMSALFLVWYFLYVITAAYLPGFMSIRLLGEINVALVMGAGQFASTIAIMAAYLSFTKRRIDPRVAAIKRTATGDGSR